MTQNQRVLNLTRGFTLKLKQAQRAVDECACAWVDYGVTFRDLTSAEAIVARNKAAAQREPLARAEIRGVRFEAPSGGEEAARREMSMAIAVSGAKNAADCLEKLRVAGLLPVGVSA